MEGQEGVAGQETIVCCGRHHQLKAAIDEGTKTHESVLFITQHKFRFVKNKMNRIS